MNVTEIKNLLFTRYPPFEGLLSACMMIPSDYVFPCSTDGKNIYYNEHLLGGYPPEEQLFYFARELIHIAMEHPRRGRGKNTRYWEQATNAVAAALLQSDGFILPDAAVPIPEAELLDAESLYSKILEKAGDEAHSSEDEIDSASDVEGEMAMQYVLREGEALEAVDPYAQEAKLPSSRDHHLSELLHLQHSGDATFSRAKYIRDIGVAQKLQGLEDLLEASVNRDYDWFPGDTVRDGIVRDTFRGYPVPYAEILIDTSLSVNEALLKAFLRYIKDLLKGALLRVGCFDTKFYGFKEIESEKDIDGLHFQGFGGTDFSVAISAFTGDAENRLIFTDGYAEMPEQRCDAIWIVYGASEIKPKGGRVLYIHDISKNTTGGNINEFVPT